MEQMVAEQAPESRLQALVSMGALITLVSVGISSLCGQDPWGKHKSVSPKYCGMYQLSARMVGHAGVLACLSQPVMLGQLQRQPVLLL